MDRVVQRVHHVGILVRSIDQSLPYYTATLGLRLLADEVRPDGTVRLAYLSAGDTTIQLVEPLTDGPNVELLRVAGEGLHHICFQVPDVGQALIGLPGEADQPIELGGLGCEVAFLGFRPNGVLVEISE